MMTACLPLLTCGLLWASVDLPVPRTSVTESAIEEEGQPRRAGEPVVRVFEFTYGATLKGLSSGAKVRVWVPIPQNSDLQSVKLLGMTAPAPVATSSESAYGNRIGYFETVAAGDIVFNMSYGIERREARMPRKTGRKTKLTARQRKLFLAANTKVPLSGKHVDLLNDVKLQGTPVETARQLYDRVDQHVKYDKSQPGYGNGDVLWVCDSRTGNCSDFHSLFIAWSRANQIPARFEIGFPLPVERGEGRIGGYHCWAMFHTSQYGWVPVDISEADKHPELKDYYFGNLTENRVSFSMGRDIVLTPRQIGPPLNFLIYPYVEVDGRPLDQQQVELRFGYKDVE